MTKNEKLVKEAEEAMYKCWCDTSVSRQEAIENMAHLKEKAEELRQRLEEDEAEGCSDESQKP